MASKKIATILSLKDKMSQPLTKVNKNVKEVTREMKKSQNQIEKWKNKSVKAIDSVVKKTAKAGLALGVGLGALAIGTGFKGMVELDDASAKVKSIAGSSLELSNIQEELLKNSTKTGIAFNELADAQYSAISSGVNAAESMDAAVISSKLAVAGFTDTNSALKLVTSTMNVYGMTGTKAMEEISDKMLTTQNLGVTSVDELANSLGSVTPIAKAVGVNLDEVLGAVGALTKGGQSTSEAMTGLKGMMTNVIKPTKQASDMAKSLGIDFSVSALKSKGFSKFLEEIKEKTGGNTDAMGKLFGSVQGLNAVLSLTSEEGFKDFNNTLGEVINSAGMTENAYDTMTNTVGFKLDKLKNTSKNVFTSMMNTQSGLIGEYIDKIESWVTNNEVKIQGWVVSIGEGVTKMVEFVKSVVGFIKEHEKAITTILIFITTIYSVIKVAAILKGLFVGLNTVMMIMNGTLLLSPFAWVALAIAAVVAAGYLLYRNWDLIKGKAFELWEGMKTAFSPVAEFFGSMFEGIKTGFKGLINFIIKGINLWIKVQLAPLNLLINTANKLPGISIPAVKFEIPTLPSFAKGTSYSPGGWAQINEEGGEIRKLSSGETIIPADKSDRLLKNKTISDGVKVIVQVMGNVIGNKQFIDEVGEEVYAKVKLALENM